MSRRKNIGEQCSGSPGPTAGRPPPHSELIRRLPGNIRRQARALATSQSRLGDLAVVFPGALATMAALRKEGKACKKAIDLAVNGAPLRDVARALDLPMWLRHLPPEAFECWWPPAPGGEDFGRRIAPFVPKGGEDPDQVDNARFWLGSVVEAAALGNERFALWLAQRVTPEMEYQQGHPFLPLAFFAWHTDHPDTRLGAMIKRPFKASMSLETAIEAAEEWLIDINLEIHLPAHKPARGLWMHGGRAGGYSFTPLTKGAELIAEAAVMKNCLRRYGQIVADRECLLFSVRKGAKHVAVVKIVQHMRETSMPFIEDIKGPFNESAPRGIWQAAYIWLGTEIGAGRPNFDDRLANDYAREMAALGRQRLKDWRAMTLPFYRSKAHLSRVAHTAPGRERYRSAIATLRATGGLANLESELRLLSHGIGRTSRLTFGI